ncbi:MAG TPA: DeoR/GlpR transcriptional regulator, partial [Planctomycetes bacterium]|nr:DeoR/GlpR transcriptional regulator [Planctomycetota bacterium]
EDGSVLRTYGGAILAHSATAEFKFRQRADSRLAEKQAIAAQVAAMVKPGMAVSIDTGTTTLQVARAISAIPDLTVLTSSLAVASQLYFRENINLVILGGQVRKNSPDLFGSLTVSNTASFRADIAVLGTDAASEDGLYASDAGVASVSRALIENAAKNVLAADSSKFSSTAFNKFACWEDIDAVVTDGGLPAATKRWLAEKAGDVIIAGPEKRR